MRVSTSGKIHKQKIFSLAHFVLPIGQFSGLNGVGFHVGA